MRKCDTNGIEGDFMRGKSEIQREPLGEGRILKIENRYFRFDRCIGTQGTSSLVYEGAELINPDGRKKPVDSDGKELPGMHHNNVIIKERYPVPDETPFDIYREEDGALKVNPLTKENGLYLERLNQFSDAENNQRELGKASRVNEIIPMLYFSGDYGDSRYLMSEWHHGWSLDQDRCISLEDRLLRAYRMGELLQVLHESGYIVMDFKPENFFWSDVGDTLILIDLDSVLPYGKREALTDSRIYTNEAYRSPEVRHFMEKYQRYSAGERKNLKLELLSPEINIYNLGQYLYFLLFGTVPSENPVGKIKPVQELLLDQYPELKAGDLYKDVLQIFTRCLSDDIYDRYRRAEEFVEVIDKIQTKLKYRKITPRKKYTKENCKFLSYKLLEEFPLYDYGWTENHRVLDVAIVGNHIMWESMLTTILSCAQMLDTVLNVRLVSENVKQKWDMYADPQSRPDLMSTVSVTLNGELISDYREDNKIVASRIANIFLYDVSEYISETDNEYNATREIVSQLLREDICRYFVLLEEIEQWNYDYAKMLVEIPGKKGKIFIGYLRHSESVRVNGKKLAVVAPLSANGISKSYFEEKNSNSIYEMGYSVHRMYYMTSSPWATEEEIRADYKKDRYNIEQSERAALNLYYKMKSIGLDAKSENAPIAWYDRVLSGRYGTELSAFDRLLWLEHLSWTAFMITHGHRGVRSVDELRGYLYKGNNNWKNVKDKHHIVHPCIFASKVGYHIKPEMWRNYPNISAAEKKKLDELDCWSLEVYYSVRKLMEDRKDDALQTLNGIQNIIRQNRQAEISSTYILLEEQFRTVERAFWNILYEEPLDADRIWKYAISDFESACKTAGIYNAGMESKCEQLNTFMKPAIWFREKHDFKRLDEAVLWAAPEILYRGEFITDAKKQPLVIYKAESEAPWENIYSSIMMRPSRLIIIPIRNSEKERLQKKYEELVGDFKLDTQVEVLPLNCLKGIKGTLLLDLTGVSPLRERKILELPFMSKIHPFVISNMECRPLDPGDILIRKLNRQVSLSVEQILRINGAEEKKKAEKDSVTKLTQKQYKILWKWYRSVNDEEVWNTFRNILNRIRKEHIKVLETEETVNEFEECATDRIEGKVLSESGLLDVLHQLCDRYPALRIIDYPHLGNYSQIKVQTKYGDLFRQIQEAVRITNEMRDKCHWSVIDIRGVAYLKNDTLYVDEIISDKVDLTEDISGKVLRESGFWEVLQELQNKYPFIKIKGHYQLEDDFSYRIQVKTEHRSMFGPIRNAVKDINRKWSRVSNREKKQLKNGVRNVADIVSSRDRNIDEISEEDAICKVFSYLTEKEKESLFPGLSVTEEKGGLHVQFRYYSEAVRRVFERSGTILGALIYHECKNAGIFDYIRCSEEFIWGDGATENEIDVIGTKNSRTYFISAKTTPLYDEHRREIFEHSYNFGIQSRAILVCSHPSSRREGNQLSNKMQEIDNRMNPGGDRRQFLLVADDVDVLRETVGKTEVEIRIADSIRKVVDETERLYREIDEEC